MRTSCSTLLAAAVLAALGLATTAQGQDTVCEQGETVAGCYERLVAKATGEVSTGDEAEELQKKAAGPNVSESLAQSAIRDFLPRFAGTLLSSDPTNDFQALDLRFNTPMGRRPGTGPVVTVQGGLTLHDVELFAPLVDSIPESIRDASRERLSKELEDGDDATGFLSLNLESRWFGRNFSNQNDLIGQLSMAIGRTADRRIGPAPRVVTTFLLDVSRKLGSMSSIESARHDDPACVDVTRNPVIPNDLKHLPLSCLTEVVRTEVEGMLIQVTRFKARQELTVESLVGNTGFDQLADLVNNQPQLSFTAEYRNRVAVVGPNEWTGRLRFETGRRNMNTLRRRCVPRDTSAAPGDDARRDAALLSCMQAYTRDPSVRRSLASSERFWAEGLVRYRPAFHVALADDSVDFTLGSSAGFGVSGGYGRYLGSAEREDKERDRLDLHLSYDHFTADDLRQSRFLAGVFYTLRISGSASGVVGLAWADKPEFLEGADRHLSANLGLSYKFNRGKEDK